MPLDRHRKQRAKSVFNLRIYTEDSFSSKSNTKIHRVGQNHIYTVFLAGKSPNLRPYRVHIYGSGQP